jgi:hypothetical protein
MKSLLDLVSGGLIEPGTKIFMKKKGETFNAEVTEEGKIKNQDGEIFKSPSGAARANNSGKPIDGWLAWRLESDSSITLDSLRSKNI